MPSSTAKKRSVLPNGPFGLVDVRVGGDLEVRRAARASGRRRGRRRRRSPCRRRPRPPAPRARAPPRSRRPRPRSSPSARRRASASAVLRRRRPARPSSSAVVSSSPPQPATSNASTANSKAASVAGRTLMRNPLQRTRVSRHHDGRRCARDCVVLILCHRPVRAAAGTATPSRRRQRAGLHASRGSRGRSSAARKLAVDEINADGGVQLKGGHDKLKLVVLDNALLARDRAGQRPRGGRARTPPRCSPTAPARCRVAARHRPGEAARRSSLFEGGARLIDPAAHPRCSASRPADAIMTRRLADYIANAAPEGRDAHRRLRLRRAGPRRAARRLRRRRRAGRLRPGDPDPRAGPRAAGPRRAPRGRRPPDRVGERGRRRRRARGRAPRRLERPGDLRPDGRGPAGPPAARRAPGLAGVAALRHLADHRRDGPEAVQRVPRPLREPSSARTRSASSRTAATSSSRRTGRCTPTTRCCSCARRSRSRARSARRCCRRSTTAPASPAPTATSARYNAQLPRGRLAGGHVLRPLPTASSSTRSRTTRSPGRCRA